jgi:hypothetical protein
METTILFCHHISLTERGMWLSVFLFRNQNVSGANIVDRERPQKFPTQPVPEQRFELGSSLTYFTNALIFSFSYLLRFCYNKLTILRKEPHEKLTIPYS